MMTVRVRYAPSPTGHLHIGGARTALFNYLFAKKMNGTYVLRIEDTDTKRNVEQADIKFLENFNWMNLIWDEGPYRCSDRLDIYQSYVTQLLESGNAYRCFCLQHDLNMKREEQKKNKKTPKYDGTCQGLTPEQQQDKIRQGLPFTVRLKTPTVGEIKFDDIIRGDMSFDKSEIGDFVIVKTDGMPVYNFAVVIDDVLMNITHVIRGEEHLPNTPRQISIYNALNMKLPVFAHVPLILGADGKKLSKRDESVVQFIEQYKNRGYLPEAIINYLALLGWSPGGEKEYFSLEELVDAFSLERIQKSGAVFDMDKLSSVNAHFLKTKPLSDIVEASRSFFDKESVVFENEEKLTRSVDFLRTGVSSLLELAKKVSSFTQPNLEPDQETKELLAGIQVPAVLIEAVNVFENVQKWDYDEIKRSIKEIQTRSGQKGRNLMGPIRAKLTGFAHGPDLPFILEIIGKEQAITRLRNAQ